MTGLVVLVTGGRALKDKALVFATLDRIHAETPIALLIHGGCREDDESPFRGADGLSDKWARSLEVPVEPHPVTDYEWSVYGRGAGPRRNGHMVQRVLTLKARGATAMCVQFQGNKGTADCVRQARVAHVSVIEVRADGGRSGEGQAR